MGRPAAGVPRPPRWAEQRHWPIPTVSGTVPVSLPLNKPKFSPWQPLSLFWLVTSDQVSKLSWFGAKACLSHVTRKALPRVLTSSRDAWRASFDLNGFEQLPARSSLLSSCPASCSVYGFGPCSYFVIFESVLLVPFNSLQLSFLFSFFYLFIFLLVVHTPVRGSLSVYVCVCVCVCVCLTVCLAGEI